eukprot:3198155-Prymnesium_polylepis.1
MSSAQPESACSAYDWTALPHALGFGLRCARAREHSCRSPALGSSCPPLAPPSALCGAPPRREVVIARRACSRRICSPLEASRAAPPRRC